MASEDEAAVTLSELERVRRHTRAAVHPAWFPLVFFGIAGRVSTPLLFIGHGAATGLFWLIAGPLGGVATSQYYGKRAVTLGAGVRGGAYIVLGVTLFVAAWLTGLVTESASGPMLVIAVGYLAFGWMERSWPVAAVAVALGVAAVLVIVTDPRRPDVILALVFGLGFAGTGLMLRRRDPIARV